MANQCSATKRIKEHSRQYRIKVKRCNLCRKILPGRLPPHQSADRCASCQTAFHHSTGAAGTYTITLSPAQAAERERRLKLYEDRAKREEPLFEGVTWLFEEHEPTQGGKRDGRKWDNTSGDEGTYEVDSAGSTIESVLEYVPDR